MEIGIPVFMFAVFPVKPQVIVMAHTSYIIQMKTAVHALLLQQKGYTNQEISKHYGVPMNHVRAWQSKARKYLQQDTKLYTLLS